MPVSQKHHESVALTVTVVAGRRDQLFHFTVGQMLPGPQIGVFRPARLFNAAPQYYCCFGGVGGLLAGAVVAPGVALVFVFVFFFFFFSPAFGAVGSAAGA